jgi:hypothetical protein
MFDPPPIQGYRSLSQAEVDKINGIKDVGQVVGAMIEKLQSDPAHDQRWVSIARTHLQQGFMAAVRAVAKPNSF